MKQESSSDIEYGCRKQKTKREEFLKIMDEIIPWEETGSRNAPGEKGKPVAFWHEMPYRGGRRQRVCPHGGGDCRQRP